MLTTEQGHLLVLHKHATDNIEHLTTAQSVLPLYTSLAHFLEKDKGVVDAFLDSVVVKNLSSLLLVGISRLLYTKRTSLSNWQDFTDRCYLHSVVKNGPLDTYKLFRGGILIDATCRI